jgi:hypothetical protein
MFAPIATPRFAMSFGMAFFSITMLLGIAGFHFADIRHWDLSSKGIRKTYYETQARVMRYYENMRLVYEIESRVRDLRRAGTPDNDQTQQQQQKQEAPAPNQNQKNPSKTENRQQDRSNATVEASSAPGSRPLFRDANPGARPRLAQKMGEPGAQEHVIPQARQNRRTA